MTWREVNRVWRKAKSLVCQGDKALAVAYLWEWIEMYPYEGRRAAALALTVVKFHKSNFSEAFRNSEELCGCCVWEGTANKESMGFWNCLNCPATNMCGRNGGFEGTQKVILSALLKEYAREWVKLPARWQDTKGLKLSKLKKLVDSAEFFLAG